MNQVMLAGRSGSDVEIKQTATGFAVANVSIATSKKVKEEWKSTWHKIVLLGHLAERVAPMIKKGSQVFVRGEIQTREWQDKDGKKNTTTEILAQDCYVIKELPKTQEPDKSSPPPPSSQWGNPNMTEDDLPF